MDSNFWFYTLSATPQTLGTVIALVATFSVFKLVKIHEFMDRYIDKVRVYLYPLNKKMEVHDIDNLSSEDAEDVLLYLNKGLEGIHPNDANYEAYEDLRDLFNLKILKIERSFETTPERIYKFIEHTRNCLKNLIEHRTSTRKFLKVSFKLNLISILACLISLPLYSILPAFFIAPILIFSSISLIYTISVAAKIARF